MALPKNQAKKDNLHQIRFHFYSLKFTPYNNVNASSSSILLDVINYITTKKEDGKGHLIDKNHNRTEEGSRELFMSGTVIMHKERRIRCSLALLRSGKLPLLKPADKFILVPFDKTSGSIAEQTHFFIDYSNSNQLVICAEYNYFGPRISDIEYYLRSIARDAIKKAKATEVSVFMDTSLRKTLEELKNVLNFDIKVQPKNLAKLDSEIVGQYFTYLSTFGQKIKPQFLKLEAMFQVPGRQTPKGELNVEANNMIKNLLKRFIDRPHNIDTFENFVIKYEDNDGQESVLNLLKGKKEIVKDVDITKITKAREFYEIIESDINEFIETLK